MARELTGDAAGGGLPLPGASRAQEVIDRFLRDVQAKDAARSQAQGYVQTRSQAQGGERPSASPSRLASRVYEDEPILLTGSQLAARHEREAREAYRFATGRELGDADVRRIQLGPNRGRDGEREREGRGRDGRGYADWSRDSERSRAERSSASSARYVPASQARHDVTWGELWSDLGTPPPGLPPRYRGVRELARHPEARRHPEAWLFCQQGRLLAEIEDDCPYTGTFERYYPSYNAMTDRQLRGYVTWRTQLRRGIVTKTATSFAFVYIYELLNGIGVEGPEDAYRRLRRFWDDYRDLEPAADRYLRCWLRDYVVYHDLPRSLVADDPALSKELILDEALLTVRDGAGQGRTPDERFAALATLSSYRIRSSRFYKEYPSDVQAVVLGVFDRLTSYYRTGKRKHDLFETLFGESCALPYEMFRSCVFYEEQPHPDATYELDAVNRYVCTDGRWTCERYQGNRRESTKLGRILKEIDARMRVRYDYAHPLREEKTPKYLLAFIEKEIDAWLAWKAAHTPRIIEIDRSRLGGIRDDAATVREELLVDEERDGGMGEDARAAAEAGEGATAPAAGTGLASGSAPASEAVAGPKPTSEAAPSVGVPAGGADSEDAPAARVVPVGTLAAGPKPAPVDTPATSGAPCGLTVQELAFVRGLLGGDATLPPGPIGSIDMLVDAVNERLFDELGDTAVEFAGDGPAIIEDYVDDVRGIVGA